MASAQHYAGPNKSWAEQAPNEAKPMSYHEAKYLLEHGRVPSVYATRGECPLCKEKQQGGRFPHKPDCEFVQATKVISSTKETQ
jgi:hypothetical protein